jgi:hypothetical protein
VGRDDLADSLPGGSAGIDCSTHSGNIAPHDRSHEAGIDLFPTDKANIRGFDHRVGSFNHRHETTTFNHSECFRHQFPSVNERSFPQRRKDAK